MFFIDNVFLQLYAKIENQNIDDYGSSILAWVWRWTSQRQMWIWLVILNMICDCWFPFSCVYWTLVKASKIVWESHVIDSSCITQSEALWVWRCDVTTSHSIQDGGVLVVNILVFDRRVQLQHCTYQRKTLLFALNKVSTLTCNREILGCNSPLRMSGCISRDLNFDFITQCFNLARYSCPFQNRHMLRACQVTRFCINCFFPNPTTRVTRAAE